MANKINFGWNAIANWAMKEIYTEADRLEGMTAVPPVTIQKTGAGKTISLPSDGRLFVKLSGSGPSYTGTPVYPTTGGGWAVDSTLPTLTCYEDNGATGLSGKVVKIRPAIGEYRFRFNRGGGSGGSGGGNPCNCTIPATLTITNFAAGDYFTIPNVNTVPPGSIGPWTATWGAAPSGMPLRLYDLDSGYLQSVSDPAWYSAAIPATYGSINVSLYIVLGLGACAGRIMSVVDLGAGVNPWFACSTTLRTFTKTTCTPFVYSGSGSLSITGTHGAGDITPDSSGNAGRIN